MGFYLQGHKSLDDVREKVALTTNQKIGLKYFDEFDERMSREEVAEIESVVSFPFSVEIFLTEGVIFPIPSTSLMSVTSVVVSSRVLAQVKVAVKDIDPRLEMVTCGSYRRGKATCGDVDILITHADGSGHVGVFNRLLSALREQSTCYTIRYTCYTILYTCYTIRYTCYTILYTCYTILYTCYTILYTCYTILYTCYTILYTCYTIL